MSDAELDMNDGRKRAVIERITPSVDGGRFAAKRIAGDEVVIEADCFADGHERLPACCCGGARARRRGEETPMTSAGQRSLARKFRGGIRRPLPVHGHRVGGSFPFLAPPFARRVEGEDLRVAALVGAGLIEDAARRAQAERTAAACSAGPGGCAPR